MIQIKVIAITAWLFCALSFNGCSVKEVYLPCKTSKPQKTDLPICGGIAGDFNFSKCVSSKYITLDGDYQALSEAFDSCK